MRRVLIFTVSLILLFSLALGVSAATGASQVGTFATVSTDGSCQVNMTVTLRLEQGIEELRFPIPLGATDVSLNGSRTWVGRANGVKYVDLSKLTKGMAGEFTVSIHYMLSNIIHQTEAGTLALELPLLSGFGYPVSNMSFSVTLPGVPEAAPVFSSGYHKEEIEKSMTFTVEGVTVSGSFQEELKDHETLTMTLDVSEAMFPQTVVEIRDMDFVYTAIGIFGGAAFLYWLLFLRTMPFLRKYCPEPPEGCTAGELGCIINTRGIDLTMTVFSWASLGYVLIQIDRNDRVILHKRMDMGNERGDAERFWFRKLFGKKKRVDTASWHYAVLGRMAEKRTSGIREMIRPSSGNPRIFRALVSAVGLFGGISLGNALANGAALQGFVTVLLAAGGAVSGWLIQSWAYSIVLRERRQLWIALGCCAVWLVLGFAAGQPALAAWTVVGLLTAGLLMCFGGRRTPWGRQLCGQVLGLRHYLRTVRLPDLQRICRSNPDYFFDLAPYALAMGVEKTFAKRFGNFRLPGCTWLTTGMDAHMTASEWAAQMRWAAAAMDARRKQMLLEKLMHFVGSFRK